MDPRHSLRFLWSQDAAESARCERSIAAGAARRAAGAGVYVVAGTETGQGAVWVRLATHGRDVARVCPDAGIDAMDAHSVLTDPARAGGHVPGDHLPMKLRDRLVCADCLCAWPCLSAQARAMARANAHSLPPEIRPEEEAHQ